MSGYPTSTNSPRVDGLSMDPGDLGCHNNSSIYSLDDEIEEFFYSIIT